MKVIDWLPNLIKRMFSAPPRVQRKRFAWFIGIPVSVYHLAKAAEACGDAPVPTNAWHFCQLVGLDHSSLAKIGPLFGSAVCSMLICAEALVRYLLIPANLPATLMLAYTLVVLRHDIMNIRRP